MARKEDACVAIRHGVSLLRAKALAMLTATRRAGQGEDRLVMSVLERLRGGRRWLVGALCDAQRWAERSWWQLVCCRYRGALRGSLEEERVRCLKLEGD